MSRKRFVESEPKRPSFIDPDVESLKVLKRRLRRHEDLTEREWKRLKSERVQLPTDVQFLGPTIEDARLYAEREARIGVRSVCLVSNAEKGTDAFFGEPYNIISEGEPYDTQCAGLDDPVFD